MIKNQVHELFKVFIPEAGIPYSEAMGRIADMVKEFTKDGKTAAKSVGVEYIEKTKQIILSIGYRNDEPGYPVRLVSRSLGRPPLRSDEIEVAMGKAAENVQNVICHEFFVTDDGEFVMVLLSHG